jgi:hypothetical protein
MADTNIDRELINVLRGVMRVQRQHHEMLARLMQSHQGLLNALSAEVAETGVESEAIRNARSEIEFLERLFNGPAAAGEGDRPETK